jgi:hypothetical protein
MSIKPENNGTVYLLTNPAMPGLVKIGMTTREDVKLRMKELYGTGVPVPFECKYVCKVKISDCAKIEKALHTAFKPNRINADREFFNIDLEQAEAILVLFHREDITNEVNNEIQNDLTENDKIASDRFKRKMRPPLNFQEMDIPIGAKLVYLKADTSIEVEVCSNRKILYNGIETSLTAVTKELLGLDYAVQPTRYWVYDGKNLSDIYNETYLTIE